LNSGTSETTMFVDKTTNLCIWFCIIIPKERLQWVLFITIDIIWENNCPGRQTMPACWYMTGLPTASIICI
jgi:hypothetical protein